MANPIEGDRREAVLTLTEDELAALRHMAEQRLEEDSARGQYATPAQRGVFRALWPDDEKEPAS